MRAFFGLIASLSAASLLGATPAAAFSGPNHDELTAAAFRVLTNPATGAAFVAVSRIGDQGEAWYKSGAHYDNCAWDEGRAWVRMHRAAAVDAAFDYLRTRLPADRQRVIDHFGYVLHATEDFYAHSNWVETHDWGVIADLEADKPAGWISGTYPDDEPKRCPAGTPPHDDGPGVRGLNKDSANREGFAEARADAILAIQDQLRRLVSALWQRQRVAGRMAAHLLGIRAQPRTFSDVIAWQDQKLFFFAGAQHYRYDFAADHVDAGYPQDSAAGFPGLAPFASDVQAGFTADGKAYFFQGTRIIRYDLARGRADAGYPQAIGSVLPGLWSSAPDAVIRYADGRVYAFQGRSYIRYDLANRRADAGYPLPIVGNWHGLEPFAGGIDAAFVAPAGNKIYFFKGGYYIRYDISADRADDGYPLSIADHWYGF